MAHSATLSKKYGRYEYTRQNLLEGFTEDSMARKVANYSNTVLAIIPTPVKLKTDEYKRFWNQNNFYLKQYGTHTTNVNQTIMPNRVACYLYDAVMLYATAATEYLKESNKTAEESIQDGEGITSRILGRTYRSESSFD
uniref:Glyco_hydro_65m domain-containing protein n=1 Tax=Bursaphelenchus xylophilus TaxID=6326 RepID=A0A1I7SKA0_BURXY